MRAFTFNKMSVKAPKKSKFDLSHSHITTFNAGKVIPLSWLEALPGDTIRIKMSSIVKNVALLAPMYQREDIKIRAFKVPYRILFNEKSIEQCFTGGKDGNYTPFPMLSMDSNLFGGVQSDGKYSKCVGTLADYLGLPLPILYNEDNTYSFRYSEDVELSEDISPIPFLAYWRIINDWFRNEETANDFEELFENKVENYNDNTFTEFFNDYGSSLKDFANWNEPAPCCWERDYFTSALSSTQRGTQVSIPLLGGQAPVEGEFVVGSANNLSDGTTVFVQNNSLGITDPKKGVMTDANESLLRSDYIIRNQVKRGLHVNAEDFSGIGAIALRTAMNLQAFLERSNISGYRYIEKIFAFFGVHGDDVRYNMAEYLGGGSMPISIGEVLQTSESANTPQGHRSGVSSASGSPLNVKTFCKEHSIIMIVGYVLPRTSYSQGLSRAWSRKMYTDYYWEQFQTIGEQEIKNKEVMFAFDSAAVPNNDKVWAYQSRYSEYKYLPDTISGDFRTSLDFWHKSRLFTGDFTPNFNNDFVTSHPTDRTFAVSNNLSEMHYLMNAWFDIRTVRPMNKYATSKLW